MAHEQPPDIRLYALSGPILRANPDFSTAFGTSPMALSHRGGAASRTLSAPVPQQDQQVEDADRAVAVEVDGVELTTRQLAIMS